MRTPFEEDLDEFFSLSEFAVEVEYNGATFLGQFDDVFIAVGEGDVAFESRDPNVIIKSIDANGVDHGDAVLVDGEPFVVVGIEPNSPGLTTLILNRP